MVCSSKELFGQENGIAQANPILEIRITGLHESSGLAASNRMPNHFWSHNDSGDTARLFAFDTDGKHTGSCQLENIAAFDWEDMSAFQVDQKNWLLVADCGDNLCERDSIKLLIFQEPDPRAHTKVELYGSLAITYPDGAHDCEAVAVDIKRGLIVLVAKTLLPLVNVYVVKMPELQREFPWAQSATASRVASVVMPMATGADFDPRTGDFWITSYFSSLRFALSNESMSLTDQLKQVPQCIELPHLKQIEAIAIDSVGVAWVTSEGRPAVISKLTK